jgi:lipid-A-disaccharide synthase
MSGPRILISAGDVSGDACAAELVRAFRKRRADARFFGMGGAALAAAGAEVCVPQQLLAVGGLLELAGSARRIARAWRELSALLRRERPDLVVLVDSGGFHLPFARRVRRLCPAPILYYVAPQVWAWRRHRLRALARRVDRVAVLFPFEVAHYAAAGVPADFVGHPLADRLRALARGLDGAAARRALALDPGRRWLALLPGSRRNEIRHHLPLQLEAARRLHERRPELGFALALAPSIEPARVEPWLRRAALPPEFPLAVVPGRTPELLRAAHVALAKPGTATLEAALLGTPLVVMGRAHPLTAAIVRRAVRVPFYAMPNLIAGRRIVPELLQEEAQPDALAAAVEALLDGPEREAQRAELAAVAAALGPGGAAERAAAVVEKMLGPPRA